MKAIITVGISASGKSTWAKEYVTKHTNTRCLERDQVRKQIVCAKKGIPPDLFQWKDWNWKWEEDVSRYINDGLELASQIGQTIILSDTNLNPKYREKLIQKLEQAGYEVKIKEFPVSLETAWKRDESRPCSVGREVIYKQYLQWLEYKGTEKHTHQEGLPSTVLVDIDGTLAHMAGRSPSDWSKVGEDSVDITVRSVVNSLSPSTFITLLSGRDSVCREATVKWLYDNNVEYNNLYMRKEGDSRSDVIVKKELFDEHIKGKYNVLYAIDDRPKVCRLWRELGIKVLQVGDPHTEF